MGLLMTGATAAAITLSMTLAVAFGMRAFGVGRARSDAEIIEFVVGVTIICTATRVGTQAHHYWPAMGAGLLLSLAATTLIRRTMA